MGLYGICVHVKPRKQLTIAMGVWAPGDIGRLHRSVSAPPREMHSPICREFIALKTRTERGRSCSREPRLAFEPVADSLRWLGDRVRTFATRLHRQCSIFAQSFLLGARTERNPTGRILWLTTSRPARRGWDSSELGHAHPIARSTLCLELCCKSHQGVASPYCLQQDCALFGFSRMQKVALQPFTAVVTRRLERPFHRVPATLLAGQTCCASFGVAHGPIPRYHQESATSLTP